MRVWVTTAAIALTIVGCGSGGGGKAATDSIRAPTATATTAPSPTPTPDSRPRVDGRWKLSFTPINYEEEPTVVRWQFRPDCKSGPCAVRARSSSGARFRLRYDDEFEEYRGRKRVKGDCFSDRTGDVVHEDVYRYALAHTLRVTKSKVNPDGTSTATRMSGKLVERSSLTKEGSLTPCQLPQAVRSDRIRAVRLGP